MNKKTILSIAIAGTVVAGVAAKKDPTVMRVGTTDVPRSEFEYLYHKNANQQLAPQSIREYADMFKLYKQKVADALAEGLDTTQAFTTEYNGYQAELSLPYAVDSTYVRQLMHEAYDRMGQEVEAYHIMLAKPRGLEMPSDLYSLADSLRTRILEGESFAELAAKYSDDKSSARRGGSMGWITALMVPYEFETAAYSLKEGEISDIVETDFGYHILKGGAHRPARGEVLAEHILLMVPEGALPSEEAKVKERIDSLYQEAILPSSSFEALAAKYSDDKGSARQGGKLNWFGVGRMVPEFDSVAFAMPVGSISEPFRTDFGYHIIKKLDARPIPTYQEALPRLEQAMSNRSDTRSRWMAKDFVAKKRKAYKFKANEKVRQQMREYAAQNGLRVGFRDHFASIASEPFMSFADKKYTVGDFLDHLSHFRNISYPSTGVATLNSRIENFEQQEIYHYFFEHLAENEPAYRNITNEYRDGMLLFEVSNRKVWDKAVKDTTGLKNYFEQNRDDYSWATPRVKGVLVQARDENVAAQVREMLDTMPMTDAISQIRKDLAGKAKVDRVLMAKGDNPLVDALIFTGIHVDNPDSKYPIYFFNDFKMLNAPEDVEDVKAQVTADYQNALESEWIDELQTKYPAVIYWKELDKIK